MDLSEVRVSCVDVCATHLSVPNRGNSEYKETEARVR